MTQEKRKTIEKKPNETQSWFFAKINKISKPLARLTRKNKRKKTQIMIPRNERGNSIKKPSHYNILRE